MNSRSYIKLTGNLTCGSIITGTTATTTPTTYVQTRTKTINIGCWNMDQGSDLTRTVSSGVPYCKIRSIDAVIKGDDGTLYQITKNSSNWDVAGYVCACCCPTNNIQIVVGHNDYSGSGFRTTNFDCPYINRGWVVVDYSVISAATLTTGNACNTTCTTMDICGNLVNTDGNAPVCEFGVVYSQSTSVPTIANCKVCTLGNITINTPFCKQLTGLADGTCTYYRAYARNCEEIGYGTIKAQCTCAAPLPDCVTVNVCELANWGNESCGCMDVSPALGVGQSFCLTMYFEQCVAAMGDTAHITVCCQPNGSAYWYDISNIIDPANGMYLYGGGGSCYCNGGGQFCMQKGDKICFRNCGIWNSGTYSCFTIYPHTCVNVCVLIGANDYNCVGN